MSASLYGMITNRTGVGPTLLQLDEGPKRVTIALGLAFVDTPIPIFAFGVGARVSITENSTDAVVGLTGTIDNTQEKSTLVMLYRSGKGRGQNELARVLPGTTASVFAQLNAVYDDILFYQVD